MSRPLTSKVIPAVGRGLNTVRSAAHVVNHVVAERVKERQLATKYAPRSDDSFVAAAYFAGDAQSTYQIEQWLWSFEQLRDTLRRETGVTEPFGILCRSVINAETVAQRTDLPVRFSRLTAGLDEFMTQDALRIVFYVNQSTMNFQALRYPRPAHVHLSHGESEKSSMVSNQLKAYDAVFVAGPAARERIEKTLVGLPQERLFEVGRPQLDQPVVVPAAWREAQAAAMDAGAGEFPVVFYAPTWEGDSPAMAYGTLPESGAAIVESLLSAGARVIYRPHPRTGFVNETFARAHEEISALIESAPGSLVDLGKANGWQREEADACVAEMSSVAFDWLASGKPLVLVEPADHRAVTVSDGLFSRVPSVSPSDRSAIDAEVRLLVQAANGGGEAGSDNSEPPAVDGGGIDFDASLVSQHYLGDTAPGAQQQRFEQAALLVISVRS